MKKIFFCLLFLYVILTTFLQGRSVYFYDLPPFQFWGSIIFEAISVLALLGVKDGIQQTAKTRYIQKNGITVNAVITGYYTNKTRINTYYPIIKFKDKNKTTHRYQSQIGMTIILPKYRKGKKVKTAYMPEEPETFAIIPSYYFGALLKIFMFGVIAVPSIFGSWFLVCG